MRRSGRWPSTVAEPLRAALLGLGTVGAGTYRVLTRNRALVRARAGKDIAITMAAVRDLERASAIVGSEVTLTSDPFAVVTHPDIDVVVEAIGGTTLARELVLQAIAHGKHVVTANKALLAEHGAEVFAAAQERGVIVAYEGAVAVSIPIIKALRESLVANRIEWVAGIINGTSNFILSAMRSQGLDFAAALHDAQAKGFAEADPRLDVDGIDAGHKLALLAANAFGTPVAFDAVRMQGIADLDAADLAYAEQLGYRIKLLGLARRSAHGLELSVQPTLLPGDHLLAQVEGSMNAVMVKGDASGITLYYGAGAGSEETASAVIADLVDVARASAASAAQRVPSLGFQRSSQQTLPVSPADGAVCSYYLRLDAAPGAQAAQQVLQSLHSAGLDLQSHHCLPHVNDAGRQALVVFTRPMT
ncbi:MAG: homoserine dehydrogenase, partial [Rhodoferax sp.]|nr:homoserine dehydrogenase [Rhodoferax sp.]